MTTLNDDAPVGAKVVLEGVDGKLRLMHKIAELKPGVMRVCQTPKKSVWFEEEEILKDFRKHRYITDPLKFAALVVSTPQRITLANPDTFNPARSERQRYFYKPYSEVAHLLNRGFTRPAFVVMKFFIPKSELGYNFVRSSYMRHFGEEPIIWQQKQP